MAALAQASCNRSFLWWSLSHSTSPPCESVDMVFGVSGPEDDCRGLREETLASIVQRNSKTSLDRQLFSESTPMAICGHRPIIIHGRPNGLARHVDPTARPLEKKRFTALPTLTPKRTSQLWQRPFHPSCVKGKIFQWSIRLVALQSVSVGTHVHAKVLVKLA